MGHKKIDSTSNQLIKDIKKLKDKKYRKQTGCFLIEGMRFVREALIQKAQVNTICYFEDLLDEVKKIEKEFNLQEEIFIEVSKDVIKELSDTVNPQGIVAVIKNAEISTEDFFKNGSKFLYLDKVQDPGNLGTIIRSAHAFNFAGVLLGKGTADPYSDKVLRSTMGSIFKVKILESSTKELHELTEKGYTLLLSDLNSKNKLTNIRPQIPFIVVIGNEANGVSDEIHDIPHKSFIIPMPGDAESLNVAVAASIIMYELS